MSYISSHNSQLLDSLENQLFFADLTSVIIGAKGLGKSFLLEQVHARIDEQVYLAHIDCESTTTAEQIEKSICLQLGLSWSDSSAKLTDKILNTFAQRVLITFDNAHRLSSECLEFILSLVDSVKSIHPHPLYILIAGESHLANKLNETPYLIAEPNLCAVFELKPFNRTELSPLIADFESIDVEKLDNLFDRQQLNTFWDLSSGNPKELKFHLHRWLNEKPAEEQSEKVIKRGHQYLVSMCYALIASFLLLILFFQKEINDFISPKASHELSASSAIIDDKIQDANSINQAKVEQLGVSEPNTRSQVSSFDKSNPQSSTELLSVDDTESASQDKLHTGSGSIIAEASKQLIDTVSNSAPDLVDKSAASDKTETIEITTVKLREQNDAQTSAEQVPFEFFSDEKKLLGVTQAQFTLQWMGLSSLQAAENFKANHPLKEQLFIYRRNHQGRYLYILISGQYNSHIDADNTRIIYAKRGYPGKPWIKKISAVQSEIMALSH